MICSWAFVNPAVRGVARSILLTATTVSSMIDTPQIDDRTLSEFERQGYVVES